MDLSILDDPERRVVGAKQTAKALTKGEVALVFIAADADPKVIRPLEQKCQEQKVKFLKVPSMDQLGAACSIQVGAAVAALLKEPKNN